jgi:hypothetical protein
LLLLVLFGHWDESCVLAEVVDEWYY